MVAAGQSGRARHEPENARIPPGLAVSITRDAHYLTRPSSACLSIWEIDRLFVKRELVVTATVFGGYTESPGRCGLTSRCRPSSHCWRTCSDQWVTSTRIPSGSKAKKA